jgi:hypothetical protein
LRNLDAKFYEPGCTSQVLKNLATRYPQTSQVDHPGIYNLAINQADSENQAGFSVNLAGILENLPGIVVNLAGPGNYFYKGCCFAFC